MEEALQFVIEMNEWTWDHFKDALKDVSREEIDWRPLAQANSINLILRHLCIEAQSHLQSIEHGEPMPAQVTASGQQLIDSVPVDFERTWRNWKSCTTALLRRCAGQPCRRCSSSLCSLTRSFGRADFYVLRIS